MEGSQPQLPASNLTTLRAAVPFEQAFQDRLLPFLARYRCAPASSTPMHSRSSHLVHSVGGKSTCIHANVTMQVKARAAKIHLSVASSPRQASYRSCQSLESELAQPTMHHRSWVMLTYGNRTNAINADLTVLLDGPPFGCRKCPDIAKCKSCVVNEHLSGCSGGIGGERDHRTSNSVKWELF